MDLPRPSLFLPLAALACACAGDGLFVDLRLTPDPDVNTEAQVVEAVESVVVVLDSPEGLYAPGEERVVGALQVQNADADPALELVATVSVRDRLPWIRVEQGSLDPSVALEVRALGLPSPAGTPVAAGRAAGVRLEGGEVAVPFDLLPGLLPPRVLEVVPGDGDVLPGCSVEEVLVVLSKPVDPRTALAPGAIVFDPGGAPRSVRVDRSARFINLTPPAWDFTGQARYSLSLSTSITDADGRPLDQVPAEDGAQPYLHAFVLECVP